MRRHARALFMRAAYDDVLPPFPSRLFDSGHFRRFRCRGVVEVWGRWGHGVVGGARGAAGKGSEAEVKSVAAGSVAVEPCSAAEPSNHTQNSKRRMYNNER